MQGFLEQNEDEMGRFMSVVAIQIILTKVYLSFDVILMMVERVELTYMLHTYFDIKLLG